MNLILFGPPGAGKGTQSDFICKTFNLIQISTGDLLRNEIKKKSNLGKQIETIIKKGDFVLDSVVFDLLKKIISEKKNFNKLVFDGYPRNMNQIEDLNQLLIDFNQSLSLVIYLKVDKDVIKKRIDGRLFCSKCQKTYNKYFNPPTKINHLCDEKYLIKRIDDTIETIIHRFDTYIDKTKPVLEYYRKHSNFHEVNGNKNMNKISNKIKEILTNLSN